MKKILSELIIISLLFLLFMNGCEDTSPPPKFEKGEIVTSKLNSGLKG